jgi:hypothetical protein
MSIKKEVKKSGKRRFYGENKLFFVHPRDVIKDDFGGKLPFGLPFRPDVRARPRLPCGRGFTRGQVFTIRRCGKNRVRAKK